VNVKAFFRFLVFRYAFLVSLSVSAYDARANLTNKVSPTSIESQHVFVILISNYL